MKKYVLVSWCFLLAAPVSGVPDWRQSAFFDTAIIKDGAHTTRLLKKAGFKEKRYTTADHLQLSCLYREKKDAAYNLVFYPGCAGRRHEGAPFAAMLADQAVNIFLVEGRNSHWSWRFNPKIVQMGEHSHHDIKAAIEFVHQQNSKPIIVFGTCAGAFYGAQACLEFLNEKKLHSYNIRGLVFDSSWASPAVIVPSAMEGMITSRLDRLAGGDGRLNKQQFSLLSRTLQAIFKPLVYGIYALFAKRSVERVAQTRNLHNSIHILPIDIFFIHSADDHIAALAEVQLLATKAQRPTTWWIHEPSRHAIHHIKHKEQYKERLVTFINKCVQ